MAVIYGRNQSFACILWELAGVARILWELLGNMGNMGNTGVMGPHTEQSLKAPQLLFMG